MDFTHTYIHTYTAHYMQIWMVLTHRFLEVT